MFEDYSSFEDYIKKYGLEKSEAILLRHLSEVYKILAQTVPPNLKTPEVEEAEEGHERKHLFISFSMLCLRASLCVLASAAR